MAEDSLARIRERHEQDLKDISPSSSFMPLPERLVEDVGYLLDIVAELKRERDGARQALDLVTQAHHNARVRAGCAEMALEAIRDARNDYTDRKTWAEFSEGLQKMASTALSEHHM